AATGQRATGVPPPGEQPGPRQYWISRTCLCNPVRLSDPRFARDGFRYRCKLQLRQEWPGPELHRRCTREPNFTNRRSRQTRLWAELVRVLWTRLFPGQTKPDDYLRRALVLVSSPLGGKRLPGISHLRAWREPSNWMSLLGLQSWY